MENNVFQSTPSAWRETTRQRIGTTNIAFQSTPSAWRETRAALDTLRKEQDFNPLPPHGGRPLLIAKKKIDEIISIHSLRMEGDLLHISTSVIVSSFQSTPSAWRETNGVVTTTRPNAISIHSLRMEGDPQWEII